MSRAFLKFFQLFSALSSARPVGYRAALTGDFERIPHSFGFVKNFFQVFSTFFPDRLIHLAFLPRFWLPGFSPAAERLLILADSPRFVNTFFRFFSSFFIPLSSCTRYVPVSPIPHYIYSAFLSDAVYSPPAFPFSPPTIVSPNNCSLQNRGGCVIL